MKREEGNWEGMLPGKPRVDKVILLHGLARTSRSMARMDAYLRQRDFTTLNLSYPSRRYTIEALADQLAGRLTPLLEGSPKLSFVTHSMGGIILRYLALGPLAGRIGRAVMLGPPNQGSEAVDRLRGTWIFKRINGPAGQQLGTEPDSLPNRLGPVGFELGVIAGDRYLDFALASFFEGLHDGKVTVERTKVEGMADFRVLHATHTFMARNRQVMEQAAAFLSSGRFLPAGPA